MTGQVVILNSAVEQPTKYALCMLYISRLFSLREWQKFNLTDNSVFLLL